MRILLLTHSFNGLAQRLFCALRADGHAVSVEFDIADSVTEEAVALWRPEVVVAPYLKRRIPASVWRCVPCLVVHPGPPGDRGAASLDWALLDGAREWGVTVLQANDDYDAGAVWACAGFAMRMAPKSSLYRREVSDAALAAVREALSRGAPLPTPSARSVPGPLRAAPLQRRLAQASTLDSAELLRRVHAADAHPGALDACGCGAWRVFDACAASEAVVAKASQHAPGAWVARRGPALLQRTVDGAAWIGHARVAQGPAPLKRPAAELLGEQSPAALAALPEWPVALARSDGEPDELRYEVFGPRGAQVGWLAFDFHNGAMSTRQCRALQRALRELRAQPTAVLVLAGGREFFSNGIHLHDIEAAAHRAGDSAAEASMRNIEAMDDVVLEILTLTDRLVVAALQGNAGAGGCFLALAADQVWAHGGVVLNPHYRNMGNLYGSEYWTYTLPRRVGTVQAAQWTQRRLPMNAHEAQSSGLVDRVLGEGHAGFEALVCTEALALASSQNLQCTINAKQHARLADEAVRPLAAYRHDEVQRMHRNFYGFDPSYHVARHHFVHRKPMAFTPRHLALHREPA